MFSTKQTGSKLAFKQLVTNVAAAPKSASRLANMMEYDT